MIIVCMILQNEPKCSYVKALKKNIFILTIIIIIIITAVELSLGGSSPYTSTEKQIRININKWNNTITVQTIPNTLKKSTHIYIILMREYVLFTSVNVVQHRLVFGRLTVCKTAISIFNSIITSRLNEQTCG